MNSKDARFGNAKCAKDAVATGGGQWSGLLERLSPITGVFLGNWTLPKVELLLCGRTSIPTELFAYGKAVIMSWMLMGFRWKEMSRIWRD